MTVSVLVFSTMLQSICGVLKHFSSWSSLQALLTTVSYSVLHFSSVTVRQTSLCLVSSWSSLQALLTTVSYSVLHFSSVIVRQTSLCLVSSSVWQTFLLIISHFFSTFSSTLGTSTSLQSIEGTEEHLL